MSATPRASISRASRFALRQIVSGFLEWTGMLMISPPARWISAAEPPARRRHQRPAPGAPDGGGDFQRRALRPACVKLGDDLKDGVVEPHGSLRRIDCAVIDSYGRSDLSLTLQ